MGNTFGQLFRVTTFGESHGGGIGVVVDGCPPRIAISNADIQQELDRRRPGQSKITTQRKEPDRCEILSGVFEGRTLGTPITVLVRNQDARPEAYEAMRETFRPSHADFTYQSKYGIRNWQGGGRRHFRGGGFAFYGAAPFYNDYATPYSYYYGDDDSSCYRVRLYRGEYRRVWVCQ